ncbi:MAG: HNH endonuclease [Clostridiales bacterium]|nr:HNH endonuclease [Clostridiales bacterium]
MASDKTIRYPTSAARQEYERNRRKLLANEDVCAICGQPVDKTLPASDLMSAAIDHIIPVSKGGDPVALENLQLTHRKCNRRKSDKLPSVRAPEKPAADIRPEEWESW